MSDTALVSVIGSCLTRDNFNRQFNADYKRWFTVGSCTNQSSMIALMAPAVDTPWEPVQPMADYGLWNVSSDLSREILGLLEKEQPAYVVLDFFGDIHFGVLEAADGRIVTNNRWKLHKTDLYPRLMELPGTRSVWWREDREQFLRQWRDALDRFADFIGRACPESTVVVHHGFNVHDQLKKDGAELTPLADKLGMKRGKWVRRSNRIWRELDSYAVQRHGWESIDLTREWWTTWEDHQWGPFDVHYTPDYYGRFLAEMHAIDVRRRLPAAEAQAVEEVRLAARRRVRDEVRFWVGLQKQIRAGEAAPPRRFRIRRRSKPDLTRPPTGAGTDHDLLARLASRLTDEQHERLATLPSSADAHIELLRRIWRPRIEALLEGLRR